MQMGYTSKHGLPGVCRCCNADSWRTVVGLVLKKVSLLGTQEVL